MSQERTGGSDVTPLQPKPAGQITEEIDSDSTPVKPATVPVFEAERNERLLVQAQKQQELRKLTAETDKIVQDNTSRRKFSWAIFTVMVLWMVMVLFVVIFCATGRWHLSDSVLIALITTTTATVIGVFVVVANYLFNRDKST